MTSNTRQFKLSDYILRTCAHFSLIIALSASFGVATLAQTASRPDRGVRPVGSYSVSDIENISLTNGNVNLSIPLAALPPIAGGALSWVLRAEYSSKPWDKTGIEVFQEGCGSFRTTPSNHSAFLPAQAPADLVLVNGKSRLWTTSGLN